MEKITQIQRQLENKAKRELDQLVDEFMQKLERYESDFYPTVEIFKDKIGQQARSGENFRTIKLGDNPKHEIKSFLNEAMRETFLRKLVEKKSEELIQKLDLI